VSLAERYPSAARSELRSVLALPMLGCVIAGLGLTVVSVERAGELVGWLAIAGALACGAFLVGLYRLREWARWGAFVVALAVLVLAGVDLVGEGLPTPWTRLVLRVVGSLYYLSLVLYLPSPAATRAFQLARSRWIPRTGRTGPGSSGRSGPAT
jgi:hypothetical protein